MEGAVRGIIGIVIGLVLVFIGLSAEWSCGLIKALGGQCYTLFGNLVAEQAFSILPMILLGIGALLIIVGSITLVSAARG